MNVLLKKFSILLLSLVTIVACNSSDDASDDTMQGDPTSPASLVITSLSAYSGMLNDSFQLFAEVRNSQGDILNGLQVTWSGSDNSVGTISSDGILRLISDGQLTVTAAVGNITGSKAITVQLIFSNLIEFTVLGLSDQLQAQGGSSITFLNETTLSSSYMELGVGEITHSTAPDRDQVYYFYEGSAVFNIDGQTVVVAEESALFIAANSNRSITAVNADAIIIVTELKLVVSQSQEPFRLFTRVEMEAPRNSNQNIWNPFLNEESVIFGLYMLPQVVGGDSRLVHGFDEINIVTRGASNFETDEGDVSVETGSIVFVREGNGHAFNMLESDIDILILWNR